MSKIKWLFLQLGIAQIWLAQPGQIRKQRSQSGKAGRLIKNESHASWLAQAERVKFEQCAIVKTAIWLWTCSIIPRSLAWVATNRLFTHCGICNDWLHVQAWILIRTLIPILPSLVFSIRVYKDVFEYIILKTSIWNVSRLISNTIILIETCTQTFEQLSDLTSDKLI